MYLAIANRPNFYYKLYSTHIESLGYSIFQFYDYITSEDIPWLDNSDIKAKCEAHLDALRIGGRLAFNCATDLCTLGEDDELLGAAFSLSSLFYENNEGLNTVIPEFLKVEDESLIYYVLAFKHGLHSALSSELLQVLDQAKPLIRAAIVEILGYRGDIDPKRIWPLFYDDDLDVRTAAMIAAMRLGYKEAVPAIEQAVLHSKEMFSEHCLLPLLMLGSTKALDYVRLAIQSPALFKPQYPIYLAMAGNQQDYDLLIKALESENSQPAVFEAMGIFGDIKALPVLHEQLLGDDDEIKSIAAKSLNFITGANLQETVIVKEVEEPDLVAEDITSAKYNEPEENESQPDEREIEIKRDSTDYNEWADWLTKNSKQFDVTQRYRQGRPFSLLVVLEELAHSDSLYPDRQRVYYELVIRSGEHIPFEPDWFLEKQITALKKWQDWWNQSKHNLTDQWAFDGH